METEIIRIAATQGLWAVLFVGLLFWVLRENAKREAEYRELVQDLTAKLGTLDILNRDVGKIKTVSTEIKSVSTEIKGCVYWIKEKLLGGARGGS